MSAISRMPAFAAWMPSPMPGASKHDGGVGERCDLDLSLSDADGLDDDHVAAGGVEHPQRLRHRARQAAQVAARRHGADEHAVVGGMILHAHAITE